MTFKETLWRLPTLAVQHLTILWCAETAATSVDIRQDGDTAYGAVEAAEAILKLLVHDPIQLTKLSRQEGVRLNNKLFEPLQEIVLTDDQIEIYKAALAVCEHKLRNSFDTALLYPETNS